MRVVPYDLDTKASLEIAESTLGKFDYATSPANFFRDPAALKALDLSGFVFLHSWGPQN